MERDIVLNRLLDKYENSKHLTHPGVSNRRVMLQIDKKDLPEYQYENASIRDLFNEAVRLLEQQGFVSVERVPNRPLLRCVSLNLERVRDAYALVGRLHPEVSVNRYCEIIRRALKGLHTPWIIEWGEAICTQMKNSLKLPSICKQGEGFLRGLLRAFVRYDALQGDSITMRAFSSICYHDTKRFERDYRDAFIKASESFHPELREICSQQEPTQKDELAFLGIYSRPELYELAGKFSVETNSGIANFSAFTTTGIAIPSTAIDNIRAFDMQEINTVIFIENKTNYDEYLLNEAKTNELIFFHGGFFSPQKGKLIQKLVKAATDHTQFYFWGDIDLGGFQMFERLMHIVPGLQPLRMSAEDVDCYAEVGLERSNEYLIKLQEALTNHNFPLFHGAIEKILQYGVTIEQEIFLQSRRF